MKNTKLEKMSYVLYDNDKPIGSMSVAIENIKESNDGTITVSDDDKLTLNSINVGDYIFVASSNQSAKVESVHENIIKTVKPICSTNENVLKCGEILILKDK